MAIDVTLLIDGEETPPDAIGVLHQRDPFPGDRTFTVAVRGLTPRQLRDVGMTEGEHQLDDLESERLLALLHWQILGPASVRTAEALDTFLNRATVATISGHTMLLQGIASSVTSA